MMVKVSCCFVFVFFSLPKKLFAEIFCAKWPKIDASFAKSLFQASGEEDSNSPYQNVCYDVSKLVDFPGFNVSAPSSVRDVSVQLGWVASVLFLYWVSTIYHLNKGL